MVLRSYKRRYYRFRVWLTYVTFVGVIIHEVAHHLTCRWFNLEVIETVYFQFDDPVGYVKHEYPPRFYQSFMISCAPFLVNTAVCVFTYYITISIGLTVVDQPIGQAPIVALGGMVILPWVGFSAAIHSVPSPQDAEHLWDHTKRALPWNPFVFLTAPVILIVETLSFLEYIGIDVAYGIGLGVVGFMVAQRFPAETVFQGWNRLFGPAILGLI